MILAELIKSNQAGHVPIPRARHDRRDDDWTVRALRARRDVQGMETLHERRAVLLRACHCVQRAGGWIDHRGADDANVAAEIQIRAAWRGHVRVPGGDHIRPQKTYLPVGRRDGGIISIECVNRVVHRSHDHDVPQTLAGNVDVRHHQRLGINLVVHWPSNYQTELVCINVLGGKNGLVQIGPGASEIVVLGQHRHRSCALSQS